MEMTTERKCQALNVLIQIVKDNPDAETLNTAQDLLLILIDSPVEFWQRFWDVMSQDPGFRAEADEFMAGAGIDAETRQSIFT